ncbi:MAG TPA: amino acid adenylation domain-containing protein [Candidatus Binatia bacterium]|nr:amino acid adenylation domain-containing protein [Candidatus Binatia bacterium]
MKAKVEQPLRESDFGPLPPTPEGTRFENLTATEGPPLFESRLSRDNAGDDEVTLSFAQERMWFFEQLEGSKPVNNISFRFEVEGTLDVDAFEWAATELVRRHESLRTAFLKREGKPVGKVMPASRVAVVKQDLTQFPESERERAATRIAEAAARDAFDLKTGPLVRLQLLRLAPERQWLIVTAHQLACDTRSIPTICRDLGALYEAKREGCDANIAPLRTRYSEYARRQRSEFGSKEDLNYWQQKLGGKLPVLDLPSDRPRPSVQTYNGGVVPFTISAELTRRLEEIAKREDVTLRVLLLAAFSALLHRYSGQEDIVVGTAVDARAQEETKELIGMFANTVALRTSVSGEMSFRELLRLTGETVSGADAHQQFPFEKLVETLQVERDLSRSPVFQVMFAMQDAACERPAFAETRVRVHPIHTGVSKYDLTMSVENGAEGLCGNVEFNSDLFDGSTIQRFCGHFEILLGGVAQNFDARIGALPLLTPGERGQILVTWNGTEMPYAKNRCVHELFEEQVRRTPDAVAAAFEDKDLTYAELNRRANAVAAHLRSLGAAPELRVGICVHRSIEMLVGLLGILKSGAAYVPLDPAYPKERLTFMLEDAQIHALLTEESLAGEFSDAQTKVVPIEKIAPSDGDNNPVGGATSENLAYVIYTSGSTGKPKGVMIRHRNVVNFFTGMGEVVGKTSGVWLAVTSICFDISVLELLWTVTRGFKVVIQSDSRKEAATSTEGFSIPEQIRRHSVTHFQCTPSLMGMLLQEKGAPEAVGSVNTVLVGGEAVTSALIEQIHGPQRVINMYGPTETTVWSTSQVLEHGKPITIGRPIANTTIYILDRFQQAVPVGVPGELHIGGAGVGRGYLNRPELTAERFIQNPFGEPDERIYRTGDLARYRADGTIEFLGRLDHQVKLRGFRIELGEIEAALRRFPGVREAVVVVRELNANDKRLAAYLVADAPIEATQLRRALKEKLPDYMVPSFYTSLAKMPLTPNGKIDRKALPEPDGLRATSTTAFVPAKSDAQRKIADIWRELLHVEKVGLNDNFFDLGAHSLLMVEAQGRISKAFGVEIPVIRLFQYPTVSALAKLFDDSPGEKVAFDKIQARARMQRQMFARWPTTAEVVA